METTFLKSSIFKAKRAMVCSEFYQLFLTTLYNL
jgi:hypothetical protein